MMRPQGEFDHYQYDAGARDQDGECGRPEESRVQYRAEDIALVALLAALMTFIVVFAEGYSR